VPKELFMRLTPVALAAAIIAGTMASAGHTQRADDQLNARSTSLSRDAEAALTAGRHEDATDLYESALAVDPRNRAAYLGLARVAQAQRLPGKAIRLIRTRSLSSRTTLRRWPAKAKPMCSAAPSIARSVT
jgi:Tfp pilus assembly protein PilF